MNLLTDNYARAHTYLRISVTDRCNLRCVYCMPAEGVPLKKREEILSLEEIYRVAKVFVGMGIDKIRITGGEPLVRKDLDQLIKKLGLLPGLKTLAMTTNGVLLAGKVGNLHQSGLTALNISLDSLQPERFRAITLRDDHAAVMAGIDAALSAKVETVKLNCVVIAGVNDDEVLDFVHFVKDRSLNVRFIEYMPFKDNHWRAAGVVSYAQMREAIQRQFTLEPLHNQPGDVARDFRLVSHLGTVSFITSMTDSFCGTCNRLRLTSEGSIKSCLFYGAEVSLRDAMRAGGSDADLRDLIQTAVKGKPEAHPPMEELAAEDNRSMVEIGG